MVKPPPPPLVETWESDPPDAWAQGRPSAPVMPIFTPAPPADAARDLEG